MFVTLAIDAVRWAVAVQGVGFRNQVSGLRV